jgi:hypothetical protein
VIKKLQGKNEWIEVSKSDEGDKIRGTLRYMDIFHWSKIIYVEVMDSRTI